MRCLVLGGAGFIGSHVVDALVARDHPVRVFDRPRRERTNLRASAARVEIVAGDFADPGAVSAALEGIEVVVHLIGTTTPASSNDDPAYDVESNLLPTLRLLDLARRARVRKIVFGSSGGTVYGVPEVVPTPEDHPTRPISAYGISKLAIEKHLALQHHLHGLDYVALRMANPYGERQSTRKAQGAVAVFLGKALAGEELTIWGDGSVERDYFYVGDLTRAFVAAVENDTRSRIYNLGAGRSHTLLELLEIIRRVTGRSLPVRFEPGRRLDVPISCLDVARARRELSWRPELTLAEGVARTWQWLVAARTERGVH